MTSPERDVTPGESHQEAFEIYVALGPSRSYRQVAEKLGVSLPTVKRWAKANLWPSRVDEREAQIARQVADRTIDSAVDDLERKRKLVKAALIRLGQAIGQGKIKLQLSDLDRMIRLDALLQGHPDGVLIGSATGAGSVEELRAYIDITPTYVLDAYIAELEVRAQDRQAEEEEAQRRHDQAVEEIRRQQERGAHP
jgi:hypothetical protein